MAKANLQMQNTWTKAKQIVQYDPTITPRSTSKYPNNPVAEMETIIQNIPTC